MAIKKPELQQFFADVDSRLAQDRTATSPIGQDDIGQFFADIESRIVSGCTSASRPDRQELTHFFNAISKRITVAEKTQRQLDRKDPIRFNVFDFIEPDENKLSDILKDLLDPKGTHGQGDVFLRLLLEQLGFASADRLAREAKVQREAATYGIRQNRRRMDLLVEAGVLLAIENKVDSAEQEAQVKDYLAHLRHCTKDGKKKGILIYLTPDQRRPDSLSSAGCLEAESARLLRCWSYPKELRGWLEACRRECKADKIRSFLTDLMAYIDTHMKRELETEGPTHEEE